MNTTASISESKLFVDAGPYAAIGDNKPAKKKKALLGLSVVLINRGSSSFRKDLFDECCKLGVREVIFLESKHCSYDVHALCKQYKKLRFLIFSEKSNPGAQLNVAFREARSDYVFVLQDDMRLVADSISSRVFSKIAERGKLCTVPIFYNLSGEELPTILGPHLGNKGHFEIQPMQAKAREAPTICPWDYTGIYQRDRHLNLGGFDVAINEPWWQKVEYGLRAWLWGEELHSHPALRVNYRNEGFLEDSSLGIGYRRFFLKILAVRHRRDHAYLPYSRWIAYRHASGETAHNTRESYRELRHWVNAHRYRYVCDASMLADLWDWGE